MTYFQFHLFFNLPVLLLLVFLTRKRINLTTCKWIAALSVIVLVATTPWDNWAVYQKIWDFDWARTTPIDIAAFGKNWRLPAEEYAFFLIETWMGSLLALLFLPIKKRKTPL